MEERRIVVVRPVSVTPVSVINGVREIKQTLIRTALPIQRSECSVVGFTMQSRQINGVIEEGAFGQLQFLVAAHLRVLPLKRRRIGQTVAETETQGLVSGSSDQAGERSNL
ncbi:hypothetical protein VIGAN_01450600 [Vigna angularis var. angularis]|uniref:Uncharacterized protein n=1 Tax=Vigna angularis var. angularis TaxID=157739 RepID=A0A0S3R7E6_PHAAN|nr:hypothetical protein VIGAN_01450600 [Vigna angularis var. angularis]